MPDVSAGPGGGPRPLASRDELLARVGLTESELSRIMGIPTHMTERERMLLLELGSTLGSGAVMVEVGSYLGASTSFLAVGARAVGGMVWAVDTWANDAMTEGPRDTYAEFLGNTAPLKDWIVPVRGRSRDAASGFDKKIDLLFVDADHSYEAVRQDLELWLPKVKAGRPVVLHDYGWAEGVKRAAHELLVPIGNGEGGTLDNIYWTGVERSP